MAKLFDSLPTAPVLRTSVQYLIAVDRKQLVIGLHSICVTLEASVSLCSTDAGLLVIFVVSSGSRRRISRYKTRNISLAADREIVVRPHSSAFGGFRVSPAARVAWRHYRPHTVVNLKD